MSRRLLYLADVARDYADAFAYYEAQSPVAASGFIQAFDRAEAAIESGLVTHQRVFEHYHRAFLDRFPYNLYYRLSGNQAVIVGVLYARFSPERLKRTLGERK